MFWPVIVPSAILELVTAPTASLAPDIDLACSLPVPTASRGPSRRRRRCPEEYEQAQRGDHVGIALAPFIGAEEACTVANRGGEGRRPPERR